MRGKTTIITGSCSGLGSAIAREFSQRGANVVLNYPFPSLREPCEDVGKDLCTPWIAVEADLSRPDDVQKLVNAAVNKFSTIDILVHNAAHFTNGTAWKLGAEDFDRSFQVNVRGAMLLTNAALPHLTRFQPSATPPLTPIGGGARIIVISSGTARAPQPGTFLYSATKAALESMVKSWAKELPPRFGCTVNAVAPGPINTSMMANAMTPDMMQQLYAATTPLEGAVGEPHDISNAVAFLAEESARWINGEVLQVNGGLLMF